MDKISINSFHESAAILRIFYNLSPNDKKQQFLCLIWTILSAVGRNKIFVERTTQMKKISKEYSILFNAITDVEKELARIRAKLIRIQQDAEETYIKGGDKRVRRNKTA